MKKSNLLLLMAVLPLFGTARAYGQVIVASHIGNNNPTTEGFSSASFGSPQIGGIANDMGVASWSTSVSSAGIYYFRQIQNLAGLDWELSTTIRVVTLDINPQGYTFETGIHTGTDYFGMTFGSDSQGNQKVQTSGGIGSPVFTLAGSGSSYHNYKLVYQAVTDTASFWIDGVEQLDGLTGSASSSTTLTWTAGFQSPGARTANWNEVSVTVIPEPSTLFLFGLAGLFPAASFMRRHRSILRRFALGESLTNGG